MTLLPCVSRRVMIAGAVCAAVVLLVAPARAIDVQLVGSNSGGQDWDNTPSDWSNNAPAAAGNDYYVDPGNVSGLFAPGGGGTLRTPQDVLATTFPGDALYLLADSQLALKIGHTGVATFPNLIVDEGWINGSINTGAPDLNQEVAGNISVQSGGIKLSSNRALVDYSALVTGAGPMEVRDRGDDQPYSLSFTNAGNSWTGDLTILEDDAIVTMSFATDVTFGDVDLGSLGILDLNGQNHTATSLAGFGPGVYTNASSRQLSGAGSITVVPEPTSCFLAAASVLFSLVVKRSRRSA